MPVRHRFYDPIIQTADEIVAATEPASESEVIDLPTIQGVAVGAPGLYLLASDVVAVLATMAETAGPEGFAALMTAADMFSGATLDGLATEIAAEPTVTPDVVPVGKDSGAANPPPHPTVARIELYPNEDASYWYARAVNAVGEIIHADQAVSGINRDLVESVAIERWPGAPVYALTDAMGDSIWDEQTHAFGFNGRRRPSPRRLWT